MRSSIGGEVEGNDLFSLGGRGVRYMIALRLEISNLIPHQ